MDFGLWNSVNLKKENSPGLAGHMVREKCLRNDWFNNGCKTRIVKNSFKYVF